MRRGRPATPPARALAAADALFADASAPRTITMDAIAAATGVGKATLFRAFGSRDGLLDALWAQKLAIVRAEVAASRPPLGDGAPPRERIAAFLGALLTFKVENRHLIRAREAAPQLLQSAHYKWMHGVLRGLIEAAAPGAAGGEAAYCAHALLATLHIDLIEEMLATGVSLSAIRGAQSGLAASVVDGLSQGRPLSSSGIIA